MILCVFFGDTCQIMARILLEEVIGAFTPGLLVSLR